MVSTRSTTKQMIRRSQANHRTPFHYLKRNTRKPRDIGDKFVHSYKEENDTTSVETTDSEISAQTNDYPQNTHIYFPENFEIDFDDAHDEWMSNKKRGPNGTYVYICGFVKQNHKLCQRKCCDKFGIYSGCKKHYKWEELLGGFAEEVGGVDGFA